MKKLLIIFITLLPQLVEAEYVATAIVIEDTVLVYAKPTLKSDIVDTLTFADVRFLYGAGINAFFNISGWVKIGDQHKPLGWISEKGIAWTPFVYARIVPDDSIFVIRGLGTRFFRTAQQQHSIRTSERSLRNGKYWLKTYDSTRNQLIKVTSLQYEITQIYHEFVSNGLFGHYQSPLIFTSKRPQRPSYDKLLKALEKFEQKFYPSEKISDYGREGMDCWFYSGTAETFAVYHKALIYEKLQDHAQTVFHYNKVASQLNGLGLIATSNLASYYSSVIKDTTKALEQFYRIISFYSDRGMPDGSQDAVYLPAESFAADEIIRLVDRAPKALFNEGEKLIQMCKMPVAKLKGYWAKAKSLAMQERYDQMTTSILEALNRYPNEYVEGLKDSNNVSYEYSVLKPLDYFYSKAQIEQFKQLVLKISSRFENYPLAILCDYKYAELLYKTDASIKVVRSAYQRITEHHPELTDFTYHHGIVPERHLSKAKYSIALRLKQLDSLQVANGEIIDEEVILRSGADLFFPEIGILQKGELVSVLYSIEVSSPQSNYLKRTKVISGTKIGWVDKKSLSK